MSYPQPNIPEQPQPPYYGPLPPLPPEPTKRTPVALIVLIVCVTLIAVAGIIGFVVVKGDDESTTSGTASALADSGDSDGGGVNEQKGLEVLRDQVPTFNSLTDDLINETAQNLCTSLNGGSSFDTVFGAAIGSGLSGDEAGGIMAYSVAVWCPEYTDELDSWADQASSYDGSV